MYTFIMNLLSTFGVDAPTDQLTVTHIVVIFAITMGLNFLGDLISAIFTFGRSVKKF